MIWPGYLRLAPTHLFATAPKPSLWPYGRFNSPTRKIRQFSVLWPQLTLKAAALAMRSKQRIGRSGLPGAKTTSPSRATCRKMSISIGQRLRFETPGMLNRQNNRTKAGGDVRDHAPAWMVPSICLLLIAITWIVFGQTLHHDFVNYDDHSYVLDRPEIVSGFTLRGVAWAFSHQYVSNWAPLTSVSHMVDCQVFGLKAAGHHFTNAVLHTISVVLLFFLLRRMTGSPSRTGSIWRSAF